MRVSGATATNGAEKSSFIRNASQSSYWAGVLLALPIAYPSVPYYLISFVIFALALLFSREPLKIRDPILIISFMLMSLASNVLTSNDVDIIRALYTSAYFIFFLFGGLIANRQAFIRGFVSMCCAMSVAVIVAALVMQPWSQGLLMFSQPEIRLWGADIFPDWPNFFAFMLSCAFLLNAFLYRSLFWSLVILLAAVLTTSRTPLLAVALFFFVSIVSNREGRKKNLLVLILAMSAVVALAFCVAEEALNELIARLFIFGDREEIYSYALQLFKENPFFGMGSILLDESVGHSGHASFHNSYLDVLVRHGLLGFLPFVLLIWPKGTERKANRNAYWAVVVLFLLGAFVQNFFKHPHLLMLYAVVIYSRGQLGQNEQN